MPKLALRQEEQAFVSESSIALSEGFADACPVAPGDGLSRQASSDEPSPRAPQSVASNYPRAVAAGATQDSSVRGAGDRKAQPAANARSSPTTPSRSTPAVPKRSSPFGPVRSPPSDSDLSSDELSRLSAETANSPLHTSVKGFDQDGLSPRSGGSSTSRSSSKGSSNADDDSLAGQDKLLSTVVSNGWLAIGAGTGNSLSRISHDDLQEATLRGNIPLMRQLISVGASVNAPMRPESDDEFMSILHILARKPEMPNVTRVIAEVIKARANLDVRSSLGSTPLSCACFSKHTDAVAVLLEAKADPSSIDDAGCTAVRCAVLPNEQADAFPTRQCLEVLQLLIKSGADLDNGGEIPPIVEAVRHLNAEAVTTLLEGGATPDGLHDAVSKAPIPMITELIEAVANPFKRDGDGKTVMEIALARGDEQITTMLRNFMGDLQRNNHPHCATQLENMQMEDDNKYGGDLRRSRTARGADAAEVRGRCARMLGPRATKYFEEHLQPHARRINKNKVFQTVMFLCLLLALFLPDIWVLLNIASDGVLDMFLVIILVAFLTELIVQMVGFPDTYIFSFFFWMDVVGVLSVPLDHSLVVNALPNALDNAVVMRAARMAKLGARAGRFTKLVKLLRFLPGMQENKNAGTAKVISRSLNMALSTRVSCLIVLMVMVLPLFELIAYPENDFSMRMWLNHIHDTALRHPEEVEDLLNDFELFYREKSYQPFEIVWDYQNGTTRSKLISAAEPERSRAVVKMKGESDGTYAMFNFQGPQQVDSLCNVLLIVTIMILMLGSGLILSNSVSAIVLTPLEELLGKVKAIASNIFNSVSSIDKKRNNSKEKSSKNKDDGDSDDGGGKNGLGDETELLEKVLKKLAALSAITVKKSPIDAETMDRLGDSDKDMMRGYSLASDPGELDQAFQELNDELDMEVKESVQRELSEADITWSGLVDWDFDSFQLNDAQRRTLVRAALLIRHDHIAEGSYGTPWADLLTNFIEGVSKGYASREQTPYHNWMHAADATFTMNVILELAATVHYFTTYERFALCLAAVCHDIGHPGKSNAFLAQTTHELAIRYNDSSPLENMHCATAFELANQESMAIFGDLPKSRYKEVRYYVIEAVLNTDYTRHFGMVQTVETLYDMNKELFDSAAEVYRSGLMSFPSKEVVDFFRSQDVKKGVRCIFLHYCDVSNPMKSFESARLWADLILEEFFMQGDVEKELELPVSPLCDRDQVNKPFSQVGFIDFFIAPMGIAMTRLIPVISCTVDHTLENLESWFDVWVQETIPPPDKEEQTRVLERIMKLQMTYPYFKDVEHTPLPY